MCERIKNERISMANKIGLNEQYDFFRPVLYEEGVKLANTFSELSQRFSGDGAGLDELKEVYIEVLRLTQFNKDGIPVRISIPGVRVFTDLCTKYGIKL